MKPDSVAKLSCPVPVLLVTLAWLVGGCSTEKNPTIVYLPAPGTPGVPNAAEVVTHTPGTNATAVSVSMDAILIDFSLGLDPSTLTDATIIVAVGASTVPCRFQYHSRQVEVRPRQGFMASSTYSVTVTQGVHDSLARPIPRQVVWSFSTESGTSVSGIISSNTTWQPALSPFILTANVQVAYGVTLAIAPGVVVDGRGREIATYGTTQAIGTAASRVQFHSVTLLGGSNPSNQPFVLLVQYAEFHGGLVSPSPGYGTVTLRDSRLFDATPPSIWYPTGPCFIERNTFVNCDGIQAGGFYDAAHAVYVRNNLFYGQRTGFAVSAWSQREPTDFQVTGNSFLSTDRIALEVERGYTSAYMLGTGNYWGTTDLRTIEDMIYDRNDDLACASAISYQPILTAPHRDTPTLSEIQPLGRRALMRSGPRGRD